MWYSVRDEVKGWPVLLKQQAAFCDRPFVRRARKSCAPSVSSGKSNQEFKNRIQFSTTIGLSPAALRFMQ
jgi:hypothetical protein